MAFAGIRLVVHRVVEKALTSLQSIAFAAVLAAPLAHAGPLDLTVMTRNLYFGADLGPVIAANPDPTLPLGTPGSTPVEVAATFMDVVKSNPAARIDRIAQEILGARPHIVGLQEAVTWTYRSPSALVGGVGAPIDAYNFVDMLQAALGGALSPYTVAATFTGFSVAAPGFFPVPPPEFPGFAFLTDIGLTDRDVILVRNDLPADQFRVLGAGSVTYAAVLDLGLPGIPPTPRGYTYVDAEISGRPFRAVSTHLEPVFLPLDIHVAQGDQLITDLSGPGHQIVLGDFNSDAVSNDTPTYGNMLAAGFSDAWIDLGIGTGLTWGQDENLLNDVSKLTQRLDYVFHRGGWQTSFIDVIDEIPDDRIPGLRLWPSDHAGLIATLVFVPEPGTLALLILGLASFGFVRRKRV